MTAQMGLKMTDKQIQKLNEELEEKVGTKITESLSEEQLDKLIEIQESKDDNAIEAWLKQNIPNLEQIVQEEIETTIEELGKAAPDGDTPK